MSTKKEPLTESQRTLAALEKIAQNTTMISAALRATAGALQSLDVNFRQVTGHDAGKEYQDGSGGSFRMGSAYYVRTNGGGER